jgi:hypothetical protein
MLAGGSVVAVWDQLERAGPKDDRQVTRLFGVQRNVENLSPLDLGIQRV